MRRRLTRIIGLMLGFGLLAGCGGSAGSQPHLGDEIKIGLNLEITGDYALYGGAAAQGAVVAFEQVNAAGGVNGKEIVWLQVDNGSLAGRATAAGTALMTRDKVLGVVGPAIQEVFLTTTSVADKQEIPIVGTQACGADALLTADGTPQPYAFTICPGFVQMGGTMARFAASNLNATRVMVLRAADGFMGLHADSFVEAFTAGGGTVVAEHPFESADADLGRFVAALEATPADAVFIAGHTADSANIIRTLRSSGIGMPIMGTETFDSPALAEIAGAETLSEVFYPAYYSALDTANPGAQRFAEAFRTKYEGAEPVYLHAFGHDAAMLIIDAIRRAETTSGVAVRDALAATSGLEGATGKLAIGADHVVVTDGLVVELVNGVPTSVVHVAP